MINANFRESVRNGFGAIAQSVRGGDTADIGVDPLAEQDAIGDKAIVSSAEIISRVTGTGPWDSDDNPGNDSSPDNDIVRSFDQVTWTTELTFGLKDGAGVDSLTGGTIEVKAELPENCANVMTWDLDSMQWLENGKVSEDGRILTGSYTMSNSVTTVPGKQTLVFVLSVQGAGNETEIIPTFTFNLLGNEENEKISAIGERVIVSAKGKYNIQLLRTSGMQTKTTLDYGLGETKGRMYSYGFTVQLYNENKSKGLKGLEYPNGEISFDIELKLERSKFESNELEDITDEATPVLWNYRINDWSTGDLSGGIEGRNLFYPTTSNGDAYIHSRSLPLGKYISDKSTYKESDYSTYNSGNIQISQNENILHVTINNYDFNGIFPKYMSSWPGDNSKNKIYTDNIGTFSVGYMQIFVPDTEASTIENRNYYLTVSDNNMKIISSTGQIITSQIITSDDYDRVSHVIYSHGSYNQDLYFFIPGAQDTVESDYGTGDGKAVRGKELSVNLRFNIGNSNDNDLHAASKFVKFDGECYEPRLNNGKYFTVASNLYMNFKVWFVTKKDGTNWTSQEEMNNGNIEDMDIYENIEDIPKDKICVGMYFESTTGYIARLNGAQSIIIYLRIKDTAIIGKTYGIIQRTMLWMDELDRSIYTITNNDIKYLKDWPKAEWDSGNLQYIKTEYDENGEMISGTHSGGYFYGDTILVVGANLHGDIKCIDSSNIEKINYDLSKNENVVTYKIEPQLDANENFTSQIENLTLKAEVTIPKGLTYIPGTSTRGDENYTEPEITKNSDGSSTLVWYLYGVTSGQTIEPILFNVQIDNNSNNNTQYEAKFVVSEVVGEGETPKIGNSKIDFRTSTTTINIINLSSYRLYKETSTDIIEANGEIKYKVVYQNNADTSAPDFQILDILPYNGDGRGSSYNGTYIVKDVQVSQTGESGTVSTDNLSLYTTTSPDARKITPKDESIGVSEIWNEKEIGSSINEPVTVIALKGEIGKNTNIEIEITLQTTNNRGGDIYYNSATAQISKTTEVMTTSNIKAEVVKRQISGMIWYDTNENGVKDEDESYANRIEVELLQSDGSKAVDTTGNEIPNVLTNSNGEYIFSNLAKGEYLVKIYTESNYTLTKANVGSNKEINSKFEETDGEKESYTIENLNGIQSPEIFEENVNAGLVVRDAKIIVKYLEEDATPDTDDDNKVLKEQDEITTYDRDGEQVKYKLGDNYSTSPADIDGYVTLRNSGNTIGTLNTEEITVTYYYTYNRQDIDVTKVWNDNNDSAGKRPISINVILKGDDGSSTEQVISSSNQTVEDSNKWVITFKDVPIFTADGERISYTVDESENEGSLESYIKSISGMTITNTFTQNTEKISIPVTKVWDDNNDKAGKRPENVTLVLKRQVGGSYVEVTRATMTGTGDEWTYTFSNIAKYDENNDEIKYIVEEIVPEFYTSDVQSVESGFEITNTFEIPDEKIAIEVTKIWNDNNNRAGKRPDEVTLVLTGNGQEYKITLTGTDSVEGQENVWKGTIKNLPKYDENANIIDYKLSEEDLDNIFYTEENITINQNTKTITNRFEVPDDKISIEVNKKWVDNNNELERRPDSVTLYLTGNNQEYNISLTQDNKNTEDESIWSGTIGDLPKYDVNGNEITYTLDERPVSSEFYTKTGIDQSNRTVTNTFAIPTENIQVPVTKIWEDNNNSKGYRPESIVLQVKNKETGTVVSEQLVQGNKTTNDRWNYTFEVPKYNEEGQEIEYEIGERDLNNKFYPSSSAIIDQENRTITNVFKVPDEKISVNVTKSWKDTIAQQDKRPAGITVVLKNGKTEVERKEVNSSNNWSCTFTDLAKYDSEANEINYTVEEEMTSEFYKNTGITGDMTNGYVITNTFERPTDKVDVTITKTWDHTNNIYTKPDSIILQVKNGDKVVESYTVTESDSWSHTFTGLDKYDENGNEIVYTVGEAEVTQGNLNYYKTTVNGTNITNIYNGPVISQSKSVSTENGLGHVVEGEKITYTITVKNSGGVAKDVVVSDTIPEGTTFVSNSIKVDNSGTSYTESNLNSGITVNVKANSETKVTFEVTVNALPDGIFIKELRNTAVVDGQNTNETTTVVNKSNLTFNKTSEPASGTEVKKGDEITYTINLNNSGTMEADAVVKDSIPTGTTFVSNSIKINDGDTNYTETDLESGIKVPVGTNETVRVSFKATVNDLDNGATIRNVATVNDTSTNEITHEYVEAEITSVKSQYTENGLDYVVPGEKIIYTIIAKNSGGLDKEVTIKDTVPVGTTFVEGSIKVNTLSTYQERDLTILAAKDLEDGITLNVPKGSGTAEGFVRLSFEVTVNSDTTGEIRNTATVDDEPTNEVTKPVLTTKKVSSIIRNDTESLLTDNQVTVNDKIKYTIRITNTGTTTISNVEVKDTIPTGTKLVGTDNGGIEEDNEITWNISSISEGETKEVSFTVKVEYAKDNFSITNVATVDGKETNETENPYVKPTPELESTLNKNGTDKVTSKDQIINYEVKFTASVDDFKGAAKVTIVDTLPYAIDISSSKLDNGTYNSDDNTITWEQEIDVDTFETDTPKDIVITKSIEVKYLYGDINNVSESILNTVNSKIELIEDDTSVTTDEKEAEKETLIEIPAEVIVHHYIYDAETGDYTTIELAPDETIKGVIGKDYTTSKSSQVPSNYSCVNEQPENYSGKMTEDTINVNYYYSLITPVVTNTMNKTVQPSVLTEEGEAITYNIKYTAEINNYIGKATVAIVDTLPSEIDVEKSDLDGGIYNSTDKTITWEETIEDVNTFTNGTYNYEFTKTISLAYIGQNMSEDLGNTVVGTINVYYPENHSSKPGEIQVTETAEDTAIVEQDYKVDLKVEKVWDDNDNQKGHRPDSIIVTMAGGNLDNKQVELNDSNNWSYEEKGLDKYDDNGNLINYSVAESEKNTGDLQYYNSRLIELSTDDPTVKSFRFTNTYKLTQADLDANITKTGTEEITSSTEPVNYEINFTSTVKDYIGYGKVIITDTLPYRIDTSKSSLNGGTYDNEAKTITWEEDLNNIDTFVNGDYSINITKNISVVFVDLDATQNSFTNNVLGKIRLYETEQEDQATDDSNTLININGDVIVKYVDIDTGEEISDSVTLTGKVGDKYTTEQKQIDTYDFVKSTPNTEGLITEETQEVTYYYQRKATQVIVKYQDIDGNELTEDVILDGKVGDSYTTEQKEFENYEFVSVTENATGTMTEETITVIYVYQKIPATVIVKYLEKGTDKQLALDDEITGFAGDEYTTDRKAIKNYQSAEPEPDNKSGTMTKDVITVIYYYERILAGDVIVKYVDIDTDEEILYKDPETGEDKTYGYTISGFVGDNYTTEQKDIPYYNFIKSTSNTTGQLTEAGDTVIYYYQKQSFNLGITKSISEITLDGSNKGVGDGKNTKVEIHRKKINTANLEVKYKIVVTNTGEIQGTAKVVDSIPSGYAVSSNNPTYWTSSNGSLETTVNLAAGETKELEVVLKWVNGETNFGTSENIARITDITNPANYVETSVKDNEDTATIVTSVETGINRNVYLIITTYLLMIGLLILLYLYEQYQKERRAEIVPNKTLKTKKTNNKK